MAPGKNDRKNIFGWCMYDWANSAYITTVAVALLPVYFAQAVVGPEGVIIGATRYSATSLWGFTVSAAGFFLFLTAPFLGAIADFSRSKKRFLLFFAYMGASATVLLFFCASGDVFRTLLLFFMTQICYIGANVFYDAFLPEIASQDRMDWISGKGFAYGYVGGGLQYALSLVLVAGHAHVGLSQSLAVRISMVFAGIWWAAFTFFTWKNLREEGAAAGMPSERRPSPAAYLRIGFQRTWRTARTIVHSPHLLLFLIAFMIYDDGIQTVLLMSSIFGKDSLHLSTTAIMAMFLVVQIVSVFGALLFGRIAAYIGAKRAIMITLVLWSGVVSYAYFITTAVEFIALGGITGIVMGGSQALSRSLYGSMIPERESAEYYGFYTVFSRFSAVWGPLVFALLRQWTGTVQLSILSLIVFFITGLLLLGMVDVGKAQSAKQVLSRRL